MKFDIVTNGKTKGCKYIRNASWAKRSEMWDSGY